MAKRTIDDLHDQIRDARHDVLEAISEGFAHMKAEILHSRRAEAGDTKEIKGKIMALTTAQEAAVKGLSDKIDEIDRSVDAAFEAATTNNQALKDQVAALNTTIAAMDAADTAEDADFTAQIQALKDAAAALQVTLDSQEADVVNALAGIGSRLDATDSHIDALGGPPPTS